MIEAAGGVVWRTRPDGDVEVLLIHRPGRRDWSLPKGKLDRGEAALDGALREVHEETGLRCEAGPELATTRYLDRKDRDKRVRYWAMVSLGGRFRPNDEVDAVRWETVPVAARLLADDHDVPVLMALVDLLVRVA